MSQIEHTFTGSTRAVGFDAYGGPDVLRTIERESPGVSREDVLVAVTAAAVNPTDLLFRSGQQADRVTAPWPQVPGMEFAGRVIDAGSAASRFSAGDRVMGIVNPRVDRGGAQSERILVDASSVVPTPSRLTDAQASTLPMGALTALLAVEALDLEPGAAVYVSGGSGVIGSFVIAIAAERGFRVTTDGRADDAERLRELGAQGVRPRDVELAAFLRRSAQGGFDGVVDAALLGESLWAHVRAGGVVVLLRGPDPGLDAVRSARVSVTEHIHDLDRLTHVAHLADSGVLAPPTIIELPFTDAARAHELIERWTVGGRVVLRFGDS